MTRLAQAMARARTPTTLSGGNMLATAMLAPATAKVASGPRTAVWFPS